MTALPTESRIFADRYGRNTRRLETLHAGRLSPGATTWDQAVRALHDRMDRATSPSTKRAAVLNKAIAF